MRADGRTLIALAEFDDHRYIQFYVDAAGEVIGEVISNLNIQTATALSPEAEEALVALGFNEPSYGPNPNYWFRSVNNQDFTTLNVMMQAAIYDVLKELPSNTVTISTWVADVPAGKLSDQARAEQRVHVREKNGDLDI
jgi:hypothetical protein